MGSLANEAQHLFIAPSHSMALHWLVNSFEPLYVTLSTAYVTRSRKRGPFPQKSVCELDLSADSAKSVVHARENRLRLARSVPKLQSFEYHTRAYLGFEISVFISIL